MKPVAFFTAFLGILGCSDDDSSRPDPSTPLKKQWVLVEARNGEDRTESFDGLVLNLTDLYEAEGVYAYSLTGTRPDPSPWPVSGTWKFGTDESTDMVRDPGTSNEVDMVYEIREGQLHIAFVLGVGAGWPGGTSRAEVTPGWQFIFRPE